MVDGRDRAVAPAVGKAMEVGVVAMYLGLVATALYAGAVPDYRSTAGDAVAERALAAAAQQVQAAVPPNGTTVRARAEVDLPDAVRGRTYAVRADGRRLTIEHPHPAVGAATPLALPRSVVSVSGNWSSERPAVVAVRGTRDGLVVRLREGGRA